MREFVALLVRGLGLLLGVSALSPARLPAQDGQFVLIDATFTATTQNTSSSEYAVAPLPEAPENWRMPIDYSAGSMHVRLEVLEKPSSRKTLCNVCFAAADKLTCMPYPPPYTGPGIYDSEPKISTFWQYAVYDWTKQVERVNVVIKDENGRFTQGNSAFFPTKLHVTVTVLPPGSKYVPPVAMADDVDAGVRPRRPPAAVQAAGAPALAVAGSAGVPAWSNRGVASGPVAAGNAAFGSRSNALAPPQDAGVARDIRDYIEPGSTCAISQVRPKPRYGVAVSIALFALWQVTRYSGRKRGQKRRDRSRGRRT